MIVNSARTPTDGVDESEAAQSDDVLVYKNDTWATPGGWSGDFALTSPVTNIGRFTAADELATIILKSGNDGSGLTGVSFDDIAITIAPAAGLFDLDEDIDFIDAAALFDCLTGPGLIPDPQSTTTTRCLAAFDFDVDDAIDLTDVAEFANAFGS